MLVNKWINRWIGISTTVFYMGIVGFLTVFTDLETSLLAETKTNCKTLVGDLLLKRFTFPEDELLEDGDNSPLQIFTRKDLLKLKTNRLHEIYLATRSPLVKEILIDRHTPFFKSLAAVVAAKHQLPDSISFEDLISHAMMVVFVGNIVKGEKQWSQTLETYDPANGSFAGYIYKKAWGAMIDLIRENDHVPRLTRKRTNLVWKLRRDYQQETHERLSNQQLEEILMALVGPAETSRILKHPTAALMESYDEIRHWDADPTKAARQEETSVSTANNASGTRGRDIAIENFYEDPTHRILALETEHRLLKALDERSRTILKLYYFGNLSDREIATNLKMLETTVNKIRKRSIKVIHDIFGKNGERFFNDERVRRDLE